MKVRKIRFFGDSKDDSLLVGNFSDVQFNVKGTFDLGGTIYCPKYSVEFKVNGEGTIAFKGVCRKLIIKSIDGDCTLDLSELTCNEVACEAIRGSSIVILGRIKVLTEVNLTDKAVLKLHQGKYITSYSANDYEPVLMDRYRLPG